MSKLIQFKFSDSTMRKIDEIKNTIEFPSRAEVVRDAVDLCYWLVDNEKKGNKFQIVEPDGTIIQIEFFAIKPPLKGAEDVS